MACFKKSIVFIWLFLFVALFGIPGTVLSQSSTNYKIKINVMDQGGGLSASTNNKISDAIGQPSVIGTFASPNYIMYAGFLTVTGMGRTDGFWADIDNDGDVDIFDIQLVAARWNTRTGEPDYDSLYDIDQDGDVDIFDIQRVASWWNKPIPPLGQPQAKQAELVSESPSLILRWCDSAEQPTLEVVIDNASDVAGFEMDLISEEGKIDIQNVEAGAILNQEGNTVQILGPQFTDKKDRVKIGLICFGSHPGSSGSGVLAKVMLEGDQIPVRVEEIQLVDKEGHPVSLSSISNPCAEDQVQIPENFFLEQNYPNPFNSKTRILYGLPEKRHVRIEIYNLAGQHMETLIDEERSAGSYEVLWNPDGMPSGIYFYRFVAGEFVETKKLVLQK